MDVSVDTLMDNQTAGCPQAAAQAAHRLPTTGYSDTTTIIYQTHPPFRYLTRGHFCFAEKGTFLNWVDRWRYFGF